MKFKIDENLPVELADLLQQAGYDAVTVNQQKLSGEKDSRLFDVCQQEGRVLVTLDLDFADIRSYPPKQCFGIMVLRVIRQDKLYVIWVFQKAIRLLSQESILHRLWIIEENKIRIRGED